MKSLIWWLLGLGVVAGGGYYVYDRYGKQIKAKDACILDLPEPNKSQVLNAIKDDDSIKLNSYASQADENGWTCAAKEIRVAAKQISDKQIIQKSKDKCIEDLFEPDKSQVLQAIKDLNTAALTNYLPKAKENGWECAVNEINEFLEEVKVLNKKKEEKSKDIKLSDKTDPTRITKSDIVKDALKGDSVKPDKPADEWPGVSSLPNPYKTTSLDALRFVNYNELYGDPDNICDGPCNVYIMNGILKSHEEIVKNKEVVKSLGGFGSATNVDLALKELARAYEVVKKEISS